MISDFLGPIGGLEFVSAEQAFTEAVDAQRRGSFGRPEAEEPVNQPEPLVVVDVPASESSSSPAAPSSSKD